MHGRGVPESVRSNLPGQKGWTGFPRIHHPMGDNVTQTETGEPLSFSIHEKGDAIAESHITALKIHFECVQRLDPERTGSLFVALAVYAYIIGTIEPDMVDV